MKVEPPEPAPDCGFKETLLLYLGRLQEAQRQSPVSDKIDTEAKLCEREEGAIAKLENALKLIDEAQEKGHDFSLELRNIRIELAAFIEAIS